MVRLVSDLRGVAVRPAAWFSEVAQETRLSPVTDHHAAWPVGAYHLSSQASVFTWIEICHRIHENSGHRLGDRDGRTQWITD